MCGRKDDSLVAKHQLSSLKKPKYYLWNDSISKQPRKSYAVGAARRNMQNYVARPSAMKLMTFLCLVHALVNGVVCSLLCFSNLVLRGLARC